jgi:RNA polymerase sigma-70 factor (ECF subfamily)
LNSEVELVGRLRRGEHAALAEVMERFGDDVYRTAYLLLGDHHLAEDVSQDTFLTAYRKIGQFDGRGAFGGWLRSIAVNHCRSRMRRASWKRLLLRRQDQMETAGAAPGPEEISVRRSLAGEILQLPYPYREVIVLHYYHDLTVKEIAERLGKSEGTVKSRLSRARRQLKVLLDGEENAHGSRA